MPMRARWRNEAWIPLVSGLAWLGSAAHAGWVAYLVAAVPGALLVASGVANGLWPGERQALHHGAAGALLGVPLGLVATSWCGLGAGLLLSALSVASFVATGALALRDVPTTEEVPAPAPSARLALDVAFDEAMLSLMVGVAARRGELPAAAEVERALDLFGERGWLEKPADFHVAPPPLETVELEPRRFRGVAYEQLRFESGYEPRPEEPGRERWFSYAACRSSHAWLLRSDPSRPWLLCIHGLGMGWPLADFAAFPPRKFHDRLGLNVVYPVLPLHGPRRRTVISGEGFLSRSLLDTVHALAQTVWDLRRLVSLIRAQGGTQLGVFGLSLGGCSTALLASFEEDLACAIPGIAAADLAFLTQHHAPPPLWRDLEQTGLDAQRIQSLLRVVSPLVLEPAVPKERRYVFGASADRLVPPSVVRDLWAHWDRPRMAWVQASHLSAVFHPEVRRFVDRALREGGLAA